MPRKKTSLEYIANDSTRRATLKKRRRGLIKKVSELATLCDVRACAVIYGEDQVQPEVWPNEYEATETLQYFKEIPEIEQSKKMMDQETFLKHCMSKHDDQLRRIRSEIHELEMTVLMVDGLTDPRGFRGLGSASPFANFLKGKAKAVRERIEAATKAAAAAQTQTETVPAQEASSSSAAAAAAAEQQLSSLQAQMAGPSCWFRPAETSYVAAANMFGSDHAWDHGAGGSVGGADHMADLMQPCMDLWNFDPTILHR